MRCVFHLIKYVNSYPAWFCERNTEEKDNGGAEWGHCVDGEEKQANGRLPGRLSPQGANAAGASRRRPHRNCRELPPSAAHAPWERAGQIDGEHQEMMVPAREITGEKRAELVSASSSPLCLGARWPAPPSGAPTGWSILEAAGPQGRLDSPWSRAVVGDRCGGALTGNG